MDAATRYYYTVNKLKAYSCFIVGGELKKRFDKDEILQAVKTLVDQRRLLRLNVANDALVEVNYDINSAVQFVERDVDFVTLLDDLHDTTFQTDSTTELLWKFVIKDQWVLMLCDHTLMDGNTGAFAVEDLSTLLNKGTITPDFPLEVGNLFTPSYWYIVKKLFQDIFNNQPTGPDKRKPSFHSLKHLIQLDQDQYNALKVILKRERIGLTALLTFYMIQALDASDAQVHIPINLRKFIDKKNERSYGFCVSQVSLKVSSPRLDWDYARWINSQLTKEKQLNQAQLVGMLKFVDPKKYLTNKLHQRPLNQIEISNLGRRDSTYVNQFVFSQPVNFTGTIISNEVIYSDTTFNFLIGVAPEAEKCFASYTSKLEKLLKPETQQ